MDKTVKVKMEEIDYETLVVDQYVLYKTGKLEYKLLNSYAKTMLKLSSELEQKHGEFFEQAPNKIKNGSYTSTLESLHQEVVKDGVINWGRIAAMFTVCSKCIENEGENNANVYEIKDWLKNYMKKQRKWIKQKGNSWK